MENQAKALAFNQWNSTLSFLRSRTKCRDYGFNETSETHWNKLPEISKIYWREVCGA